jgi:isopropylmalate/homocitrate/citramalate synthase
MEPLPASVRIVEVGPRDGLQNEPGRVPTAAKIALIDRLSDAGLRTIEASSFVSPRAIPQLADAAEVLTGIRRREGVAYPVLVPNLEGLERALAADVDEIAVFTAASETFNRRNINATIRESLERFRPVAERARSADVRMRGYISCVLGCPYEGEVPASRVVYLAETLIGMGCYEVSLGDTIGIGTPLAARRLAMDVGAAIGLGRTAIHFHDTRGQALANVLACLDAGIGVVDAAVAGLGGCPYAGGATGNVATEDLAYMLEGMGVTTGIDLDALVAAGLYICEVLGRPPGSRLGAIATRASPMPEPDSAGRE